VKWSNSDDCSSDSSHSFKSTSFYDIDLLVKLKEIHKKNKLESKKKKNRLLNKDKPIEKDREEILDELWDALTTDYYHTEYIDLYTKVTKLPDFMWEEIELEDT